MKTFKSITIVFVEEYQKHLHTKNTKENLKLLKHLHGLKYQI